MSRGSRWQGFLPAARGSGTSRCGFQSDFRRLRHSASSGGNLARAKNLAGLPVWVFHSARCERGAPIDADRQMVAAIKPQATAFA